MQEAKKILKLIGILLGCIGAANAVLLGIYITSLCMALASISMFWAAAIVVTAVTITSTALIFIGCILINRNRFVPGGVCNIIAGTITAGTYLYYTIGFPILQRFGLVGYFLLLPAPISGLIVIIALRKE